MFYTGGNFNAPSKQTSKEPTQFDKTNASKEYDICHY